MIKLNYFNTINLIRHIAAILVIYAHSFELMDTKQTDYIKEIFYVDMGFLAVNVFFFLSGALIYQSVINSKNIISYFFKRGIRILPALWVCVFFTTFLFWIDSDINFTSYISNDISINHLLNIFLIGDYTVLSIFDNNVYPYVGNGSLWTLRYEVLMYVIVSIFVFFEDKNRKYILHFLFFIFFTLFIFTINNDTNALKNIGRLGTLFFAGAISSRMLIIKYKKEILLLLFVFVVLAMFFPFKEYFISLFFIILLKWFIDYAKSNVNDNKKINFDISYGLYIYAFPVQQFLIKHIDFSNVYVYFSLSILITCFLAILSWFLVESKALEFKNVI